MALNVIHVHDFTLELIGSSFNVEAQLPLFKLILNFDAAAVLKREFRFFIEHLKVTSINKINHKDLWFTVHLVKLSVVIKYVFEYFGCHVIE